MSKITNIITPQNFELIRDRIADVLQDEVDNQFLSGGDYEIDAQVYLERTDPFDKEELPAINVSFAGGPYSNKDVQSVNGTYQYNIDVYTKSKTSAGVRGDSHAAFKLQKLLGICRYVLENPVYKTLGFQTPFINRVYCEKVDIAQANKEDGANVLMGRITFIVVTSETVQLITPRLIDGYDTEIKIAESQKGYKYTGNNYP